MNVLLGHGDMTWLMSGAVVFIGLMVFLIKLVRGRIISVIASAIVWVFVYKIHSGSTAGIMTATLAALLFDVFGMPLLKVFMRR